MLSMNHSEAIPNDGTIGGFGHPAYPVQIPANCDNCPEWTYIMRRNMQEIVPGLFLGPYSAATKSKYENLMENSITHIVCVRQDIEAHFIKPNFPDKIKYLTVNIADSAHENIIQHFPKVRAFIDEALKVGKVLVHGNAGISRSAALVMAYLMEKMSLNQTEAYILVQNKRFCINPNEGFMAQLREFEPIYQAHRTLKNGQSSAKERFKRSMHEMDLENSDDRCIAMDS